MKTVFIGSMLIDGTGAAARPDCTVIVDGTKILEVNQQRDFGSEVQVIDVSGKTIMPGLIDCHKHFAPWLQFLISYQEDSLGYLAGQAVCNLKGALESGCTSARDMGGLEAGWGNAQAKGLVQGPRLQHALVIISPTNGHMEHIPGLGHSISQQGLYTKVPGIPTPWCDGVDACRAKVREVLRYGAHFIKITNSAIPWANPKLNPERTLFRQEEVDAIVDEAHRAGVPVCAHVTSKPGALMAVEAGVDTLEHGCFGLDEELAAKMVKRDTWLVPTFAIFNWHLTKNPNELMRKNVKPYWEEVQRSFALAMKEGVKIAMGTDDVYATGVTAEELELMVKAGMTPTQAIAASTGLAAECMQIQDEVGTLSIGKEADLLVVDGDPLQDISVLQDIERLSLVMQAGKPVAGPMVSQFPWQRPDLPKSWH